MRGEDGRARCVWGSGPADYRDYHDAEWGRAVHGDTALFERLSLEAFQSGLSWLTILRKREGFRRAFSGFDPQRVADYEERDIERLMGDASIVRNRRKIEATVSNARALVALQAAGESLDALVWSHRPPRRARPRSMADIPAASVESTALSRELKRRGFSFVGPTTMHAAMQACGLIDEHVEGCFVAEEVRS